MESNRLINVIGWYDKNNIGDEAYKISFKRLWPNANFVFTNTPIDSADEYVIGGGDVVSFSALDSMIKIRNNKHMMSVSFPDNVYDRHFDSYYRIWVRDQYSLDNAIKSGIKNAKIVPDFAFSLNADQRRGNRILKDIFKKENLDLYSSRIGIIMNAHMMPGHNCSAVKSSAFEKFTWELSSFCDNYSASFVFIPFGTSFPWDDRAAASAVASKCKFWKKNCAIYERMKVQDTLDLISSLDATINARLHGSIFSTIGATPFIDITHNHKNINFLKTINEERNAIEYASFQKEKLKTMIDERILCKNKYSADLKRKRNEQKRILKKYSDTVSFV